MRSPILVCDVDGVVVDLSYSWYEWLQAQTWRGHVPPTYDEVKKHYNYSIPFSNLVDEKVAMHFWKQESLYDDATPMEGVVEGIQAFKERGWEIVFASHVEGAHALSKYRFLKKYFPVDGFMATREKHYIKSDIAIDDKIDNLIYHEAGTMAVLQAAPYNEHINYESLRLQKIQKLDKSTAENMLTYWWKFYAR
ncbi:MAG: hypothetical protein M0R77_07560 [Gammaproteobacteria bacterium]|nr:hypothetical protein [Gammaproteobacteria bacterium]